MRNSTKGVLLSALVYPGLGQIALKSYLRGVSLIVLTSWGLYRIVAKMYQQIVGLLDGTEISAIVTSTDDIVKVIIDMLPDVGGPSYRTLLRIISGCWLAGIVDSWLSGRRLDLAQARPERVPDLTDSVEIE